MENFISQAYTYLECNKSFTQYKKKMDACALENYSEETMRKEWRKCRDSYFLCQEYMTDDALTQCFQLMINEF